MGAVDNSPGEALEQDWDEVAETIRMLNIAAAQIALAVHDGNEAMAALDSAFTSAAADVAGILGAAEALNGGAPDDTAHVRLAGHCADAQASIESSIVALQFYDRLSQRLAHVRDTLEATSGLLDDRPRAIEPGAWRSLQSMIRKRYTMREEQVLFDALSDGASVETALDAALEQEKNGDDGVELF